MDNNESQKIAKSIEKLYKEKVNAPKIDAISFRQFIQEVCGLPFDEIYGVDNEKSNME